MDKSILFHISDQELSPTQSTYDHISNIDTYEDNSIKEILYQDLCDYCIDEEIDVILKKAYDKLDKSGNLHIQGSDFRQLGIAITFNMVDEQILKKVMYPNKKSIHTMSEMLEKLKSIGFKVSHKKYINIFEYYIKCYKD